MGRRGGGGGGEKELQWTRKLNLYINDVSRISWISNMTNLAFWVKE